MSVYVYILKNTNSNTFSIVVYVVSYLLPLNYGMICIPGLLACTDQGTSVSGISLMGYRSNYFH